MGLPIQIQRRAAAEAADAAYNNASLSAQAKVLEALEVHKDIKFVPQMITESFQQSQDVVKGISDWCDRFEIANHKHMPSEVMAEYCSHLQSRDHPDPILHKMGKKQYFFVYRGAEEHIESDGSKKTSKPAAPISTTACSSR